MANFDPPNLENGSWQRHNCAALLFNAIDSAQRQLCTLSSAYPLVVMEYIHRLLRNTNSILENQGSSGVNVSIF